MTDTIRTKSSILGIFPDNLSGEISPQDLRDFVVSVLADAYSRVITTSGALTTDDHFVEVDASSGSITLILPALVSHIFIIKKTDSTFNTVTIVAYGSDLIDEEATLILTGMNAVNLKGGSTKWLIF